MFVVEAVSFVAPGFEDTAIEVSQDMEAASGESVDRAADVDRPRRVLSPVRARAADADLPLGV